MKDKIIISPSILSADFTKLGEDIKTVETNGAKYLHFDVMDGHFVPNISFGPYVLECIKKKSKLYMDVHLMIDDPAKYYLEFIKAGANCITFHYESFKKSSKILEFIKLLKEQKVDVGMSVKPGTDVEVLEEYLAYLDMVLIMSVEPGFGGQKFNVEAIDRIKKLKTMIKTGVYKTKISVDGGINAETGAQAVAAGADILVLGSYIFKGNVKSNIKKVCHLFK